MTRFSTANYINASASSIQTSRDQLQEQLRAMHLNTNLSDMAKAISDLSPILDDRVERDKLKRAMDYLIAQAKTSSSTRALGSSIAPRIALEGGQSSDINQIMRYISKINSDVSLLCSNRNAGKQSGDDNKTIRLAVSQLEDLKRSLSYYLRLFYPSGILFIALSIGFSSFLLYRDIGEKYSELTKTIDAAIKINQRRSQVQPTYENSSPGSSLKQSTELQTSGGTESGRDLPSTPSSTPENVPKMPVQKK